MGLEMLEGLWLGLELASFCPCSLQLYLHRSLTSSVGLPKQVGHNAATEIILPGR